MSINSKIETLYKIIFEKNTRVIFMSTHGLHNFITDEEFVKTRYESAFGKKLNLENPVTYTEKLQWLKLYDHCAEYSTMVDKISVKKYVANKIGDEYIVPLLGVWDKADDIDFEGLPSQFVLKSSHDSGGYIVCKNKESINKGELRKKVNALLKRNYYYGTREWPYKNVPPRVFAEEYLEDSESRELRDYKFFTFGGEPKVLYITSGRGKGDTTADFFDMEGNHLDLKIDHEMAEVEPKLPKNFELMKSLARKLSEGTPQLRVDFYEVNGRVYFGELTFFHCGGLVPLKPEKWDKQFGEWVDLPEKLI